MKSRLDIFVAPGIWATLSVMVLATFQLLAGVEKPDDFDIRYWTRVVSQSDVTANDSMVQLFINAPECMPMETKSLGFPRYVLGAQRKLLDEFGRGWLIECATNWDARAQVKRNGSEEVHIYPQEFKSSLIFEPKKEKK